MHLGACHDGVGTVTFTYPDLAGNRIFARAASAFDLGRPGLRSLVGVDRVCCCPVFVSQTVGRPWETRSPVYSESLTESGLRMSISLSLTLACLWAVLANVIAMLPSKRAHWPAAYGLIALGVPLLGYVTYENGPWIGLIVFAAGVSILRWPVIFLGKWIKRMTIKGPAK